MITSVIFLIKFDLNRHIKHENPLSIYENMDFFSNHVGHCAKLKISENIATIYQNIFLCLFQYQYCGNIVKTRLYS